MSKKSSLYLKGRKCFKCESCDTRKNTFGSYLWYSHKDGHGNNTGNWICYSCKFEIGKQKTPTNYFQGRTCCICGNDNTRKGFSGNPHWYRYKEKNGIWDRKSYICTDCWQKKNHEIIRDVICSESQWRSGVLSRYNNTGIGVIGQWISASTLGIIDLNIVKDNFHEHVDLSKHQLYGEIEVKTATLIDNRWIANYIVNKFDTLLFICMDGEKLWKNVDGVYAIPYEDIIGETEIYIYKNTYKIYKFKRLEKFRIDKRPFNDTYHSVEIPEFFGPLDLWKGKYDISGR